MNLNKKFKRNKGITLIALVVTIIVLLILAGISISMLTGQNGILNRASEAKSKNGTAQNGDLVKLSAMDALSQGLGTITDANLKTALNNNIGEGKYEITGDATNGWTVTVEGEDYRVEATGIVNGNGSSTGSGNWDKILEDANKNPESMKHKEQVKSSFIGIGTDGKPVNMDLWRPSKKEDGTWGIFSCESSYAEEYAYDGGIDDDGKIVGKIPQYIYSEEEERFVEVTDLSDAFYGCTGLTTAPEIPSGVIYMNSTFANCERLTTAPEIPNSVTYMRWTFSGCTNLTGEITINANIDNGDYGGCFSGTTKPIQLTGTCPILSELAETSENGNVTVK